MRYTLDTSVQYLKGVGPKIAELFGKLGVKNIEDLLYLVPRDYVPTRSIKDIKVGERVYIIARVLSTSVEPSSKGDMFVVKVTDGTGNLDIRFFKYSPRARHRFRWNKWVGFEGEIKLWMNKPEMMHPSVDFNPPDFPYPYLPIYPLTLGLTQSMVRRATLAALRELEEELSEEILPEEIVKKENFLPRHKAFWYLHYPPDMEYVREASRRLSFEELFYLQLLLLYRKQTYRRKGIAFPKGSRFSRQFLELLQAENPGFKLTKAQVRVLWEIFRDMESPYAMNRLLQGDVGSGKTIVATFAILKAIEAGYQAAFMAPTEILAEQHYISLKPWFEKLNIPIALLIGSVRPKDKKRIHEEIAEGKIKCVVGTHALIEEKVKFKKLGFVVIDEQHRFGVMQRVRLRSKGRRPDFLVMTATPIPRTLTLTIYGDLDVSIIDEMPPGRKPIITKWYKAHEREAAYEFLRAQLDKGAQAYVVFPLVEESEKVELRAATSMFEELQKGMLAGYSLGLIHGRLPGAEKERIMHAFRDGKIQALVATTVIEVGIDVPNATVILIEHAERFGLAQLHQLRGRVCRSTKQAYCLLISSPHISEEAKERLSWLEKETDGFKIAEKDLELRGPGEILGVKQHGKMNTRLVSLLTRQFKDERLIFKAINDTLDRIRMYISNIMKEDPLLTSPQHYILQRTLAQRYTPSEFLLDSG